MNPNWLGVVSAILAFVAFFAVYRSAKDKPFKMRAGFFLLSLLAAIPGVSFSVHYAHVFPEPSWYYQFRSVAGTELLVVFLGVAGGFAATLLPRVLLILPLLGAAAFSIVPFIKPFIGPIPDGELKDQWDGAICLQSTASTCGAASTATILRFLGGEASESELAAEAHSYNGGTEAWYLARASRSRGYDVHFDFTPAFSPDGSFPALVGVRLGSTGHFIAILDQQGDKFLVGDPLFGRELLSREDLQKRYAFTGFRMRIKTKGAQAPPSDGSKRTSRASSTDPTALPDAQERCYMKWVHSLRTVV
jgi:hypothetical protein